MENFHETVALTLDEQSPSSRDHERSFVLRIENCGKNTARLLRASPMCPPGVEWDESIDTNSGDLIGQHRQLCDELSQMLMISQKTFRDELLQRTSRESHFMWLSQLLFGRQAQGFDENRIICRIAQADDADKAKEIFIDSDSVDGHIDAIKFKKIFDFKAGQLRFIEKRLNDMAQGAVESDGGDGGVPKHDAEACVATIPPGSSVVIHYIIRFPRANFGSRKFTFYVSVVLAPISLPSQKISENFVGVASKAVIISGKPMLLGIIAASFGVAGSLVRNVAHADFLNTAGDDRLLFTGLIADGAVAALIAPVAFLVYDRMDLDVSVKTINVGVRSAAIVGFLTGVFQQNLLEAFWVLVGS